MSNFTLSIKKQPIRNRTMEERNYWIVLPRKTTEFVAYQLMHAKTEQDILDLIDFVKYVAYASEEGAKEYLHAMYLRTMYSHLKFKHLYRKGKTKVTAELTTLQKN